MPADYLVGLTREPSWHGQEVDSGGVIGDMDITLADALRRSSLDYELVFAEPVYRLPDGSTVQAGKNHGVLRPPIIPHDPVWRVLATKSPSRYDLIQNRQLAELFEPINEMWPLETLGALSKGSIVWFEFRQDPWEVAGDEHRSYLLLGNRVDGALFYGITSVRVVCWNTFSRAISGNRIDKIAHTGAVHDILAFRRDVTLAAEEQREDTRGLMELFTRTPVKQSDVDLVARELFSPPDPPQAYRELEKARAQYGDDAVIERRYADLFRRGTIAETHHQNRVEAFAGLRNELAEAFFRFNDENPSTANTAYALFNGVTDVLNHTNSWRGSNEQTLTRVMFGDNATRVNKAVEILKRV